MPLQFDFIIVGGGTSGALLANRLSADAKRRVLLIEAGGRDDYHWVHIPIGYLHCIGNPRTDWMYQTQPCDGLHGRSLRYPRGKVLGGSSSINGMIYMRGQAEDYEGWAQAVGDEEWRWPNCLRDFMRHEDHWRLDNETTRQAGHAQSGSDISPELGFRAYHGHGGEWRVDKQRLRWDILDAFAQAAQQAGIPATLDFNRGDNHGVGYFEVNQKKGWRWNTAKAFLRPTCYGRSNFEMWTQAQVSKLLLTHDGQGNLRCTGVQVWTGKEMVQAHAQREVILAAGSIGSPQILELSGLGQASRLRALGITPLADLPGVGENLQDHLQIRSVYTVEKVQTLNTLARSKLGKAHMAWQYLTGRKGPLSMAPSQLGAFTRSDALQVRPNLEFHVQPLSLDAFGEPLHAFNAFTASVCNLQPTSRGSVHLSSPDFSLAPTIAPQYLSTEEDRVVAVQSLRITRAIVAQPALQAFAPQEYRPGAEHQSDEALLQQAGDIASTIFHPVGTARMGKEGDSRAVVNARLQVRGVQGLRVVDASVMPTITSGNTNSPTLMIAEKAAGWIVASADEA